MKALQNFPQSTANVAKIENEKEEEKIKIDIIKTRGTSLSLAINRAGQLENYNLKKTRNNLYKD